MENSIYVHRDFAGRGVGRQVLMHLLGIARESGFHAVIARIEASSEASRALHAACGFELVGSSARSVESSIGGSTWP